MLRRATAGTPSNGRWYAGGGQPGDIIGAQKRNVRNFLYICRQTNSNTQAMGFVPFTFVDFIDIILVAVIMYWIYRMTKGTNAPYILSGIIAIYLLWVVVRTLNMELLSTILGQLISVGAIALIIVFQPELRRFLQVIGDAPEALQLHHPHLLDGRRYGADQRSADRHGLPRNVGNENRCADRHRPAERPAADRRGRHRPRRQGFDVVVKNIFFKNAPLHDGAVLIEGDRIVAAKCILPVTQSDVPKSYGTRHRAAIGMSEISDAIIIVVSEETGGISIAQGGELRRNIDPVRLQQTLQRYLTINTRKRSKKEVAE